MITFKQFVTEEKVTKDSVDYSKGMKESHCGICVHYDNSSCELVEGSINPQFWCKLFKKC